LRKAKKKEKRELIIALRRTHTFQSSSVAVCGKKHGIATQINLNDLKISHGWMPQGLTT
jgi:hypothetical protein